jgi:hypothetical protein
MKMRNIIPLLLVAASLFMTSCDKEFDLQPTDTFNETNAFLDLSDAQRGLWAAYGRYSVYANDMYVSALLSDEAKLGPENAGQGATTYRYQFSSDGTTGGDVTGAWGSYYSLIDQCNRVLAVLPSLKATEDYPEAKRTVIEGQLKALRALGHFGLLRAYCKNYDAADPLGVPIMLVSNPLVKPARNNMGEVMSRIESDLTEAKILLSNENFTETEMNSINIAAFQAKIALFKRDYNAAISYATEVISSGARPVATNATDLESVFADEEGFEVLFRIVFNTSTSISTLWTTTSDDIYIAPSDKLLQSYRADTVIDIRKDAFFTTNDAGNPYVKKFYTGKATRVVDLKPVRMTEMHLIRAEAYAKLDDVANGKIDLEFIREKRYQPYTALNISTKEELLSRVLEERYLEFPFEGMRYFDLKRNELPVQRAISDANQAWIGLPANDFRFVLPIPRDEINANPNMVQNANYF